MDNYQQFYPLFAHAIANGEMDVCQWIESGTSVETALPDLYELVNRKRMWRAIIVDTEHDTADTKYPASRINPYDYLENANRKGLRIEDGKIVDCQAPLIRLTHLLGGIPSPEPEFESVVVELENKVPKIEYHPIDNEYTRIAKKAYFDWEEANKFQGVPPTEIILVKVRKPSIESNSYSLVQSAWKVHTEADSSTFWKRNFYPHNCRFLVFDTKLQGVMNKQQDMFRLWVAILLIAGNSIDPNVLQAHRLYTLDINLDDEQLTESFQETVNQLNMAKYQIEKEIEKELREQTEDNKSIPNFKVHIPISFREINRVNDGYSRLKFGLTGGYETAETEQWHKYSNRSKKSLKDFQWKAERTLDKAAANANSNVKFLNSEVTQLTKYQEEDMRIALDEEYERISNIQTNLPEKISNNEEHLNKLNDDIIIAIKKRVTTAQALSAFLISMIMISAGLIPVFVNKSYMAEGGWILAGSIVLVVVTVISVLIRQRSRLMALINQFRNSIQNIIHNITLNAELYSNYFSGVASYIRGRSYLNIMKNKQKKKDSSYYFKQKHLKSIEIMISRLSLWASALRLKIDLKSVNVIKMIDDENNIIDYESLYSFDNKECEVPLNTMGAYIKSPFSFVKRLMIEREELYDDVSYK